MRSALILGLTALGQISAAAENSVRERVLPKVTSISASSTEVDRGRNKSALAPPGNPLWAIPIGSLSATVERPIFEPSRRPPPAKVPDKVPVDETVSRPPVSDPLGPPLVLLGAVANERKSIAIFRDQTTKNIVRLEIGDSHSGWTLRRVNGREATFNRGRETSLVQIEIP
jgi:general secretion pathway protein N